MRRQRQDYEVPGPVPPPAPIIAVQIRLDGSETLIRGRREKRVWYDVSPNDTWDCSEPEPPEPAPWPDEEFAL